MVKMHKKIIYSDDQTKRFGKLNYTNVSPRWLYLISSYIYQNNHELPAFLSAYNWEHNKDIKNIEAVIRNNKIRKKDLSLVIFDSHTDMYQDGKGNTIDKKVDYANWIARIIMNGYSDINIIGVLDFTYTRPEIKGFEYFRFKDKVTFFVGEDFNQEEHFKTHDSEKLELKSLGSFTEKQLRPFSFISLDCDVSYEFTSLNPRYVGRKGNINISSLKDMVNYVRENSTLCGISIYGMWDSFIDSNSVKNIQEILRRV